MDEKMPIIKKTHDLDQFRLLAKNRKISKARVNALKKSIQRKNLLHLVPIVINDSKEIIDGQTRWSAAKDLKLPIYYLTGNDATVDDMIILNAYQRSWCALDYLNFWMKMRRVEYIRLKEFSDKYHISPTVAMLCQTMQFTYSTQIREDFKSGNFTATKAKEAQEMMDEVVELRSYCLTAFIHTSPVFLHAYAKVRSQVPFKELKMNLDRWGQKIERRATRLDYLRHFEDLINKGKSKNLTRLY